MNMLREPFWNKVIVASNRRVSRVRVERHQCEAVFVEGQAGEVSLVSELCHMPPETPVKHRRLREHVDAHRCCGKSLIRSALVRLSVLQHARTESISKRA